MYNVVFSESVRESLESFEIHTKDYFFRLYTDTGIEDESLIVENYYEVLDSIITNIVTTLKIRGSEGMPGRKEIFTDKDGYIHCTMILPSGNHTLSLEFRKNNQEHSIIFDTLLIIHS